MDDLLKKFKYIKNGHGFNSPFKEIKQKVGDKNCLACVVCMITRTEITEWEKRFGIEGRKSGYSMTQFIIYLAEHDFSYGGIIRLPSGGIINGNFFNNYESINLEVFFKHSLVLSVKSSIFPKHEHVVFWDGEKIYDPSPLALNTTFKDYEILEIAPIVQWIY